MLVVGILCRLAFYTAQLFVKLLGASLKSGNSKKPRCNYLKFLNADYLNRTAFSHLPFKAVLTVISSAGRTAPGNGRVRLQVS